MGQNSITMFTNDSGVAGGPTAYTQDVFQDVTDTPSTNSGWSSTISSNPLNNLYGNDDVPRYGPKTLWIKDLVLEPNRQFWINGEPTYRIVWSEPYPSAQGYVFGNVQLNRSIDRTIVTIKTSGDGFGVGGIFARVMFLMVGNTASAGTATGTVAVDGVSNTTTVDWSNLASGNPAYTSMYAATVHAGANEAYNIHDFRLTANQSGGVFTIAGVVLYSENSTLTIDQFPGTTYNNKSQAKTSANTTLPLPSFGSSMGGRSTIWKNAGGGYSMSTIGVSTITSIAQGNNATSVLNLTTGTGASFLAGYGIITASTSGASPYVGVIQSISTDALTVFPALPFGISNSIYTYFKAGQSLAINASLNTIAYSFGTTEMYRGYSTMSAYGQYLDPLQNFMVWGNNFGVTLIDAQYRSLTWNGASGFIQCEGYFSAAEIEWSGMSFGVLSGTMIVNGLAVYNHNNIGFTGTLRKTVFHEAGPGWNNFAFFAGASHINVGISKINLYTRKHDVSATYGILAAFDTIQAFTPRANNATFLAPGVFKRVYADQLLFTGSWTRIVGATLPGGVAYVSSNTNSKLAFQYYGTNFSIVGGASLGAGASMTVSLDSGSNLGATCMNTVVQASQGFHSVSMAVLGGTVIIGAIDFFRTTGEMKNLQLHQPFSVPTPKLQMPTTTMLTSGSGTYFPPAGVVYLRLRMVGGGGGGAGSAAGANLDGIAGTAGGNTTFGSWSAGGGSAGQPSRSTGATGGQGTLGSDGVGTIIVGGDGGAGSGATGGPYMPGGTGGNSFLGGGGSGGGANSAGNGAVGPGGGGGGGGTNTGGVSGAGGGGGGGIDAIIYNVGSVYNWSIGTGGPLGGAGTSGFNGAAGANGKIIIDEYYQIGFF